MSRSGLDVVRTRDQRLGRDNWTADVKRMPDGQTALRQGLHRCQSRYRTDSGRVMAMNGLVTV